MSLLPQYTGQVKGLDVAIDTDLAAEPVLLADAKLHLKIDYDDEDDLITSLITVARQQLEGWSGLAFGAKTVKMFLQSHRLSVDLPIGPVDEVSAVKINAGSDSEETLTSGDHYLLIGTSNKKLRMYGLYNDVEITYTTSALDDISFSESIKAAVKAQVAFLYQNRGDEPTSEVSGVAKQILQPHRRINVF